MIEILEQYGFNYHHGCRCGGSLKKYYRKGVYEVQIAPTQNAWKLSQSGARVSSGKSETLEDNIKNL